MVTPKIQRRVHACEGRGETTKLCPHRVHKCVHKSVHTTFTTVSWLSRNKSSARPLCVHRASSQRPQCGVGGAASIKCGSRVDERLFWSGRSVEMPSFIVDADSRIRRYAEWLLPSCMTCTKTSYSSGCVAAVVPPKFTLAATFYQSGFYAFSYIVDLRCSCLSNTT